MNIEKHITSMKFVSWNVNGLRAALGKGFEETMLGFDADCFCVQETKMHPGQLEQEIAGGYELYWNSAERRGYSGTATARAARLWAWSVPLSTTKAGCSRSTSASCIL